ncbi:uncharacterized protein MONOS_5970 [Monocercomonoides exilis]|uniref:uncharacterized protein n=1 Tax=Monocercomonoides exilis TaxID=2049356 RepID=UPI00355972B7|nr:hypothetical protein MONOS_5970 [Monocercomonoides exilis]|eukprot:MONOS_5970.1-p1 / transcript=MONOS_5970.1 / gene=MONOS_5970 / organism=Monocercomonoides_exilis_PA203 / gene_product=unspecified product / transcript_product=unspecified product / location=Mono_scaffold00181:66329-67662(+) / protein_length=270 / sequence_SO=supercontig / SO=protein_coding / is_pseudo=false
MSFAFSRPLGLELSSQQQLYRSPVNYRAASPSKESRVQDITTKLQRIQAGITQKKMDALKQLEQQVIQLQQSLQRYDERFEMSYTREDAHVQQIEHKKEQINSHLSSDNNALQEAFSKLEAKFDQITSQLENDMTTAEELSSQVVAHTEHIIETAKTVIPNAPEISSQILTHIEQAEKEITKIKTDNEERLEQETTSAADMVKQLYSDNDGEKKQREEEGKELKAHLDDITFKFRQNLMNAKKERSENETALLQIVEMACTKIDEAFRY